MKEFISKMYYLMATLLAHLQFVDNQTECLFEVIDQMMYQLEDSWTRCRIEGIQKEFPFVDKVQIALGLNESNFGQSKQLYKCEHLIIHSLGIYAGEVGYKPAPLCGVPCCDGY